MPTFFINWWCDASVVKAAKINNFILTMAHMTTCWDKPSENYHPTAVYSGSLELHGAAVFRQERL